MGTAFEMASTPVRAVAPDENAWRITNSPSGAATWASPGRARTGSACGHPPVAHWVRPTRITANTDAMKAYVGQANSFPASRTPRRFARVSSITNPVDISTVYGSRCGANETMATTPATTDTATVMT